MIGEILITNDGTGNLEFGNYDVALLQPSDPIRDRTWKTERVTRFPRNAGPYALLHDALQAAARTGQISSRARIDSYEIAHPWLSFSAGSTGLVQLGREISSVLNECRSLCDRLRCLEELPESTGHLYRVNLSERYSDRERNNIMLAWKRVHIPVAGRQPPKLSPARLRRFNRMLLDGEGFGVTPGQTRRGPAEVGGYIAVPAGDCDHLLRRLCDWVPTLDLGRTEVDHAILRALVAHVYLVWIHPFGDGNGRTARLLEYELLLRGGVPRAAAHLLSNHYNQTRDEYERQLALAVGSRGDLNSFATYAVKGLAAELAESVSPRPRGPLLLR